MKNVRVHRVNFFEPDPKSIRCIAYDNSISRIALSRADASIEIWDISKNPYLEKIIPNIQNASVETLSWCNGRLFSAGLYGYIIEYDLSSLSQKYQLLVTSGCPIWCMGVNKERSSLAVGNEDGHVVLHSVTTEGLDFQTKFDKQEGSILCLAWHKAGHIIVTGSKDAIRVWNVDTGHVVNRIILGRTSKNTPTIVWCISVLSDMTIISGDSTGKTSFWDGNTGTLSNQAVHKEDVLTLCVSENEDEIYTSGVDFVIQMFMQSHSNGMWLKSVKRIVHTHDVRALQLVGDFLVSGGDDCNLVFTKYPPKTTIKYFPFCQMSYSTVAPLASCILLRYPNYLTVWKIGTPESGNETSTWLQQIIAKKNEVITCSSMSADGKWIAYSSQFKMRLFHFHTGDGISDFPVLTKILLPEECPNSAIILSFTPDSTKLIAFSKGNFFVIKCDKEHPKMECIIEEDQECGGQTHLMELSSNGLYLASGSHNGSVVIYDLKSQKVLSRLPLYKYQPTALKFDPPSENLIVAYSDRKVIEYCLKREAYSNWSKKDILLNLQEASYHPISSITYISDTLFLSDENCIYAFKDKSEQLKPSRKKVKQSESSVVECGGDTYSTITRYEHISSIHNILDDLVVIEIPSRHIENSLPPPIFKKKYGT